MPPVFFGAGSVMVGVSLVANAGVAAITAAEARLRWLVYRVTMSEFLSYRALERHPINAELRSIDADQLRHLEEGSNKPGKRQLPSDWQVQFDSIRSNDEAHPGRHRWFPRRQPRRHRRCPACKSRPRRTSRSSQLAAAFRRRAKAHRQRRRRSERYDEIGGQQVLEQARKCSLRAGSPASSCRTGWGDPAETIIETVPPPKIDILVVGRRGRGRLSALLLGSSRKNWRVSRPSW